MTAREGAKGESPLGLVFTGAGTGSPPAADEALQDLQGAIEGREV